MVRSYTPELKELNELTVVTTQKDKIARENKEAFPFIRIKSFINIIKYYLYIKKHGIRSLKAS